MDVMDGLQFLTQGVVNALSVGAIWPSGRALCRAMVDPVFDEPRRPMRILEVGAGVGPVTAELVDRLIPEDRLDVVELNPKLFEILRKRFEGAVLPPTLHNADILAFDPPYRYDHIISGLPLANFPTDTVAGIYRKFFDLLEPGGTLVMFHHVLSRAMVRAFAGPRNRRRAREVMTIEDRLRPLVVGERLVVLNVPPARVLVRRRPLQIPAFGA